MKSDKPKKCSNCSYDKHYEVCHIKDVKHFPEESFLSEVNQIDNLISYCRNCHWEFDNGLLQ
jgi:predicted restriction endonuclease